MHRENTSGYAIMKSLVILLALFSATLAEYRRYDGYKVYEVTPVTPKQIMALKTFENVPEIDFWSHPRQAADTITIMVAPSAQASFEEVMITNRILMKTIISDVEKVVEEERHRQLITPKVPSGRISFTQYHRYDEMGSYLEALASSYPDLVTVETPGESFEGRPLYMVKISANPSANNPIILVDGGIHAREWISPAVVMYIINQLVENSDNRHMIENVDWYIVPVLNPDGYEYTHTNERFWRKTRSIGKSCYGVDGNRNFDFHWMETGASSNECSETYAGPEGFSEKETQFLRDQTLAYAKNIKLYLTFHSYGNYLLYPWGYTSALPDNAAELQALAEDVNNAISVVDGTTYTIGSSTNVLYAAAGGSDDWVKGVGGVELSYTIELPGGGILGFDLPASRITPVCIETFQGVKVYHQYIADNFAKK